MSVTTEGFRALATRTRLLAETLCGGRVVAFQEGGYGLEHLPFCNLALVEGLADLPPSWERDPLELDVPAAATEEVRRAVSRAAARTPR